MTSHNNAEHEISKHFNDNLNHVNTWQHQIPYQILSYYILNILCRQIKNYLHS